MKPVFSYFESEDLYPDLDTEAAVSHLSEAVRCRTVNDAEHSQTDYSEFDRLQALMRQSFPAVMKYGRFELIGHAVLITVPGSDPGLLPCLYMSHQDVVPVVAGTEQDWRFGPFSGAVEEDEKGITLPAVVILRHVKPVGENEAVVLEFSFFE